MDPFKPRAAHGPEYHIQGRFVDFLTARGWLVERMVGNAFQKGVPDLFLGHPKFGLRWVDIKVYGHYNFTREQRKKWPEWEKFGVGIWIIGASCIEECTKEHMIQEYDKLFLPPNWRDFWRKSWDTEPSVDDILREITDGMDKTV